MVRTYTTVTMGMEMMIDRGRFLEERAKVTNDRPNGTRTYVTDAATSLVRVTFTQFGPNRGWTHWLVKVFYS